MSAPFDRILTVDFETRYAQKPCAWTDTPYTLRSMTTEEYIRSPKFKAFGLCAHEYGSQDTIKWVSHKDIAAWCASVDWSRTAVLCHNAQFDAGILSFVYGVRPAFIFDTLSMARALRGAEGGNSLAKLAEDFGLPAKGTAVHNTDGVAELYPLLERSLAEYCVHDVWLCEQVFTRLKESYPVKELKLIDMTIKMYTEAELVLDREMLQEALKEEHAKLTGALERCGVAESDLASNDKFAHVLRNMGVTPPTKISKVTGKEAYAFAKSDALFQQLLEHDNEDIALLCEARKRVKSTTERTRAQRFIDIAGRGALPVPLSYYGAATGRYSAAKGSQINLQNLKRGSALRKAIMAPEGSVVVAGDLSQIEPRVLAWLADYEDMLDIFRAGGDPYATFGAQMFGIPGLTKETHPLLRQSAKSALLGCFGGDTPVLTLRGWVPIVSVKATDMVWDGVEFVAHSGLKAQGEKEVWTYHGVSATSDHEILTEHGWVTWSEVLQNPSLFQSAIRSGNLPVSAGNASLEKGPHVLSAHTNPVCGAVAGMSVSLNAQTYAVVEPRGVTTALRKRHVKHAWRGWGWQQFARTENIETGYSTGSAQSSHDALTQKAAFILTTGGEVLRCIRHGWKTALSSLNTLCRSLVGITPTCSLTAPTTNGGMSPETYVSSPAARTCRTNGVSPHEKLSNYVGVLPLLKQRMQTYDIAYAGPRNRYTILTNAGPMIVHNCGYGLGFASFSAQLLVGFLGAPPQRYNIADAKQLGVDKQSYQQFIDSKFHMERVAEIPHTCTDDELVVHCLAAKAIIDKYRAAATPVVDLWGKLNELIQYSLVEGKEHSIKGIVTFAKGEMRLVNGMSIRYPDIQRTVVKGKPEYTFADGKKRKKLYGGLLTNNMVQGTARIIMTDAMLRVHSRYPCKGSVHDELWCLAPEITATEAKQWVYEQMVRVPTWMPGIPLDADVGAHRRYGLAKG